MDPLVQLILIVLVAALFAFWAWMFWEMINNRNVPDNARNFWMIAFVIFNIFAAVYYYMNVYRDRL